MEPVALRAEIEELKKQLQQKEEQLKLLEQSVQLQDVVKDSERTKLSNEEIARFSRQIIIPGIGVKGQLALKTSSVLIVGAGGLGCPSALYLAGAGVVPGTIGVLQALEAIKIILKIPGVLSQRLLLFDGFSGIFRNVRLRKKNPDCHVCGENPKITTLIDYEQFCGSRANDKDQKLQLIDARDRITPLEYRSILNEGKSHILVDVRPPMEYEICHIDNAINIPLDTLNNQTVLCNVKQLIDAKRNKSASLPVVVVCRRGNASQKGVIKLKEHLTEEAVTIKDIIGGLHGWAKDVDKLFPVY